MQFLRYVSDMLSERVGEMVTDEASLKELLADVNTMLEKLLEAQLPEDLKVDLVDHLAVMHSAIIDYRLFGVESLKKTVDSNLGLIVRRYDEMRDLENSEGGAFISDFIGFISRLSVIISVSIKCKELAESFLQPMLSREGN